MEVFEAIAQPKRREILRLLAAGERTAGDIAGNFAVTQPAMASPEASARAPRAAASETVRMAMRMESGEWGGEMGNRRSDVRPLSERVGRPCLTNGDGSTHSPFPHPIPCCYRWLPSL